MSDEEPPTVTITKPQNLSAAFSLDSILGNDHEVLEPPSIDKEIAPVGWDEEEAGNQVTEGHCVECEDQPANLLCETCADSYCEVCFSAQHRKGSRKRHVAKPLSKVDGKLDCDVPTSDSIGRTASQTIVDMDVDNDETEFGLDEDEVYDRAVADASGDAIGVQPVEGAEVGEWFVERAKYIPVRLTLFERKLLRLLEAALSVSEYTDRIDTIGLGSSKDKRIVQQIRELCAILSGLVLSANYKKGQKLFQDRTFQDNAEFYQAIFELGRRHKIMNPDKMRTTYGKLIYLLQDSQDPEVKQLLNFSCVSPIKTVYNNLEEYDALDLLRDNLITIATKEIYSEGRTRREIQKDIKRKERAIEILAMRFEREGLSQEDVRQCLYSIGDNHAFLRANRDPCDRMISYLKEHFHPSHPTDTRRSLAIRSGRHGARLSHDHTKQFSFVLQSLTLWREVLQDMFYLWSLAEQDLLSENISYRLRDTGQGLNRVQAAPKTSRMMRSILHRAQKSLGGWVGSTVIHMGDHNVPNALLFIDKYTQIYRILLPICNTLSQIPLLSQQPGLRTYIENEFGSLENLIVDILGDFFRHGFDGSGADNFFDAGSCIDGRLTSAWNWCSCLEKKKYFYIFLLSGFVGFDGDW